MSANLNQMMPPDSLPSINVGGMGGLEGYAAQVQAQQAADQRRQSQTQTQGYSQNQNQGIQANTPGTTAAIDALFNTNEYFNMDGTPNTSNGDGMQMDMGVGGSSSSGQYGNAADQSTGPNMTLYTGNTAASPYNDFAMLGGNGAYGQPNQAGPSQRQMQDSMGQHGTMHNNGDAPDFTLPDPPSNGNGLAFDFSTTGGFGGEMLAGEGMDTVSDLQGGEQGL